MKKLFAAFFLCLMLQWVSVFAQTAQPSTTPPVEDDGDVVVITTNLIQIDATVTDKKGNVVTDLTAEDFEIYENKEKQSITNFSFVSVASDVSAEPTEKPAKNSIPAPPVTTRLKPEQVRRTISLVVDDLSLSFSSTYFVQRAVRKFVDEEMQSGDLVAIIRTSGGIGALQQFTSDKRQLYAAIEKIRWNPAGRGGTGVFASIDETLGTLGASSGADNAPAGNADNAADANDFREEIFAVGTLGAINYVVRGMRELPGRKAVILLSDGFPIFSRNSANSRILFALQQLTDLSNRSAVVIYAIDARGLIAPGLTAEDDVSGLTESQFDALSNSRFTSISESQQGLQYLARETGGFSIINSNDINWGIRRVLKDQKGYYLLGYQPDGETFDPKTRRFNKLNVKIKRPNLKVRFRSGFFGIKDEEAKPALKTPQQQIANALTSPFSTGDINLRLTSLYADDAQKGAFMRSLIHVKGGDVKFAADADGWSKAVIEVVAITFGDNGVPVENVSRTETIRARADTLREIEENGFVYTVTVPIKKPGAYQMRVVLRDAATAKLGSATQFVEVPNLKKNRLTVSGIVLERIEQNTAAPGNRFQSNRQRDAAVRRFRVGSQIQFGYAIYNAKLDKADGTSRLTTRFKLFRDGKEIFAGTEAELKTAGQTDLQRILHGGAVAFNAQMPPGEYVLQVIVKDSLAKNKRQMATQWIDFEIVK